MLNNIILMNGYGFFVWSAFLFTFLSCFYLYFKSLKELKAIEKIYLVEEHVDYKIKLTSKKNRKIFKEAFSKSSIV